MHVDAGWFGVSAELKSDHSRTIASAKDAILILLGIFEST
jgi:hypothetical protein